MQTYLPFLGFLIMLTLQDKYGRTLDGVGW